MEHLAHHTIGSRQLAIGAVNLNIGMSTSTKPVAQVDLQTLNRLIDPATNRIMKILRDHHVPTRIVGGAVRDLLLRKTPRDIDLVVDADPSEVLFLLELYGIESDVGGIAHGTVKAVFRDNGRKEKIEITSLGYRIRLRDKRPLLHKAKNWSKDSAMRDLSINAMSLDLHGHIWDYQGGYKDLKQSRVRMLPDTRANIQDDPNQIMRYFKALTMFPNPRMVKSDLDWIRQHVHLLQGIEDDDRVMRNLLTIQKSPNSHRIIALMCELGIKQYIPYLPC
jgi:tRNA nucleotidyltransferase/poly(A) polymerase